MTSQKTVLWLLARALMLFGGDWGYGTDEEESSGVARSCELDRQRTSFQRVDLCTVKIHLFLASPNVSV